MLLTVHAPCQGAVRGIVGVCFRLLGTTRNSDSVVSTAAATVRQVVALVFQHVSAGCGSGAPPVVSLAGADDTDAPPASYGTLSSPLLLLDDLCNMATGPHFLPRLLENTSDHACATSDSVCALRRW